jgi:cobalamin-dependent methionine synthase I
MIRLAADCLTAANPRVAQALADLNPAPLQELARRCQEAGAQLLDLNPGYLPERRLDRMAFLVEAVQEAVDLPLILDSPQGEALARGLAVCRDQPILSALTLEPRKLAEILPLAVAHDCDLVVLLLDERSFSPPGLEEKLNLAMELSEQALAAGLPPERLIFDPVLPNLSWPDALSRTGEAVQAVRWLASGQVFGEAARTMAGLSNLRSGLRRHYAVSLDTLVMALLAGAGLSIALADVLQPEIAAAANVIRRLR